jgi:hypothetical protein
LSSEYHRNLDKWKIWAVKNVQSPYDVRGLPRKGYNIKLKLRKYLRDKLADSVSRERDIYAADLIEETESFKDFL